jgi:hypothetical protein
LQLFLDELRDRAFIYDWHDILLIKKQGMGDVRDLVDSYGEISFQEVKESANEYFNIPNRAAQESFMMYNCIINSLTNSAKRQIQLRGKIFPFVIGGVGIGPMLLKVVMMVLHVDTRVTISAVSPAWMWP